MNKLNKPYFELYKIKKEIIDILSSETSVDENGELLPDICQKLDALSCKKEELIHEVGLAYLELENKSQMIENEIKRLQDYKKSIDNKVNFAKKIIAKNMFDNDNYSYTEFSVKWRDNPPKVIIDENINLEEIYNKAPDIINIEYKLNKNKIKEYYKSGKPLPKEIKIIKEKSLIIK